MDFNTLIQKSALKVLCRGGGNPEILGITGDSRAVRQGDLFVAIPGSKVSGDSFIAHALAQGAVAVASVYEPSGIMLPWVQVEKPRFALGVFAKTFWGIDCNAMTMVGITGTNGKTTTAHFFKKLFEKRHGAADVWMYGTIQYELGNEIHPATHTTPETLDIMQRIGSAARGPSAVVMEVSSHSLALDRVGGLLFDLVVLTNLTQDHLDFHQSMENYYQAKKRLFTDYLKKDGRCVINIDDPWGQRLVHELPRAECITFGKSGEASVRIVESTCSWSGTSLTLAADKKRFAYHSSLRGSFNVYNMAGLVAGAHALGYTETEIAAAFSTVQTVPGRMDLVAINAPFTVVVDYAHTPDALVNVLQTVRPLTKGKIIAVFGCGGDRDRTKRPLMGRIVAANSDEAIVTSDNPRSEHPMAIIEEILDGMPLDFPHWVVPDRRIAIKKALETARPGDCIIIAGKGHETYQEVKGVRHMFDDREIAAELYAELKEPNHA
ncbi:MAG: UDP-N-acetylmuramoyl-L-alanyl-D-glutamate--2,6-diaminopimelate ligase [Chitinispirillaceae bacterium]|nr:UDP-N-acetylmuramoyl-L-alanyl-D-glutamate--2,6-diaminopimelate ligase [Chitinispirillaceae bacterium]